ncbi:MAG: type II toxin-antitoxin system CcdA family antitoxin [Thermofilaceae archaeon]
MTEIITVRLSRELKRKVKELNINMSEVVRRALEEEVERRERELLVKSLAEARKALSKLSDEEIIQAVRASREERCRRSSTQALYC